MEINPSFSFPQNSPSPARLSVPEGPRTAPSRKHAHRRSAAISADFTGTNLFGSPPKKPFQDKSRLGMQDENCGSETSLASHMSRKVAFVEPCTPRSTENSLDGGRRKSAPPGSPAPSQRSEASVGSPTKRKHRLSLVSLFRRHKEDRSPQKMPVGSPQASPLSPQMRPMSPARELPAVFSPEKHEKRNNHPVLLPETPCIDLDAVLRASRARYGHHRTKSLPLLESPIEKWHGSEFDIVHEEDEEEMDTPKDLPVTPKLINEPSLSSLAIPDIPTSPSYHPAAFGLGEPGKLAPPEREQKQARRRSFADRLWRKIGSV